MLVNCTNCRTPLQLPPGARSIRCAVCHAISQIAAPIPSPSTPAPPATPPPAPRGKKKAVICGISYRNSRHELKGCINDAKCMRYLLINKFNFTADNILMLTGSLSLLSASISFSNFFLMGSLV